MLNRRQFVLCLLASTVVAPHAAVRAAQMDSNEAKIVRVASSSVFLLRFFYPKDRQEKLFPAGIKPSRDVAVLSAGTRYSTEQDGNPTALATLTFYTEGSDGKAGVYSPAVWADDRSSGFTNIVASYGPSAVRIGRTNISQANGQDRRAEVVTADGAPIFKIAAKFEQPSPPPYGDRDGNYRSYRYTDFSKNGEKSLIRLRRGYRIRSYQDVAWGSEQFQFSPQDGLQFDLEGAYMLDGWAYSAADVFVQPD
jgi:hypothetical protein